MDMATIYLPDEVFERTGVAAMITRCSPQEVLAQGLNYFIGALDDGDRNLIESVCRRRADQTKSAALLQPTIKALTCVQYQSKRLTFRRDPIAALASGGLMTIATPHGTFEMTKSQFEADFPNVVSSESYTKNGVYHYPTVPEKAKKYLK
jgi:hypothetical protein